MNGANLAGLLAIDVGTSRVKLGWFPSESTEIKNPSPSPSPEYRGGGFGLPEPMEMFDCSHREQSKLEFAEQFAAWLGRFVDDKPPAVVASVNPEAATKVAETLKLCGFAAPRILRTEELPIQLAVHEPARVGIDRVLAAVAVNRIRAADKPAIVVSLGTACTVNLISADGTFEGGAILPGLAMAGQALHAGASSLPLTTPENLEHPKNAIGKNTAEAISAGIYWGLVGSIERLIREQSRSLAVEPQLILTGGDAPLILEALTANGHAVRLVPHLVLAGIAIACEAKT